MLKEIARDGKIRLTMRLDEDERIGRDQDEPDRFSQRRQPSGLSHKRPAKRPASLLGLWSASVFPFLLCFDSVFLVFLCGFCL